jgi:4-hydroxybenzoate polyprenyltransferase
MSNLSIYFSFVRFSHSVFALPFAFTGALLAWQEHPFSWAQVAWIALCMLGARSAAMGFNRLVDAPLDRLNPRTAMRELPRGAMSRRKASVFVLVSSMVFLIGAWQLSPLCLALAPVALVIVFWYSLAKRYTPYTQLFLGLAMALAPVGGWVAAGGSWGLEPWLLGFSIGFWVSGFDVLYACQDVDFDRRYGLQSIPTRFGVIGAIRISRSMHVLTVIFMAALWRGAGLPTLYLGGVLLVAVLLAYEQSLVQATDLSKVKQAFDLNGYVGIVYFAVTALSLYLG